MAQAEQLALDPAVSSPRVLQDQIADLLWDGRASCPVSAVSHPLVIASMNRSTACRTIAKPTRSTPWVGSLRVTTGLSEVAVAARTLLTSPANAMSRVPYPNRTGTCTRLAAVRASMPTNSAGPDKSITPVNPAAAGHG